MSSPIRRTQVPVRATASQRPAQSAPLAAAAPAPRVSRTPQSRVAAEVTTKNRETGRVSVVRQDEVRENVDELASVPHVARVSISGGLTVNMGDFEFVRADVTIDMPCLPTDEAINDAREYAKAKVVEFLQEDVASAKARRAEGQY